jgi:hypothetical protein
LLVGPLLSQSAQASLAEEEVKGNASTAAGTAARGILFRFRDARDVHAREG